MSQVYFPLQHYKYSGCIQKKSEVAVSRFFESIGDRNCYLGQDHTINVDGHSIRVGEKKLWFKPGSKSVIIREAHGKNRMVNGQAAVNLRSGIKELQDHAAILNLAKHSFWDRFSSFFIRSNTLTSTSMAGAPALISKPFAEEIRKHSLKAILAISFLMKGAELSKPLAGFIFKAPLLTLAVNVIGYCGAAFQLVEGGLSLLFGSIELFQGIKHYQIAKQVHDVNGMIIARQRIIFGLIYLAEGMLWISLAVLFIIFPHVAVVFCAVSIVFTILQYTFRAVFVADSATSLAKTVQTLRCVDQHRWNYEMGILKNEKLSLIEKQQATRGFIQRLMAVTEEEKVKISEKCRAMPSKIAKRLQEKLAKKRMTAQRLGINEEILLEKNNGILFERVQTIFNKNTTALENSKCSSIFFLIVNLAGFPISVIDFSKLFNKIF